MNKTYKLKKTEDYISIHRARGEKIWESITPPSEITYIQLDQENLRRLVCPKGQEDNRDEWFYISDGAAKDFYGIE